MDDEQFKIDEQLKREQFSRWYQYIKSCEQTALATGGPEAIIQWKNTAACLDVHCTCGQHLHFDEECLYSVVCEHCQRVYSFGDRILIFDVTGTEHESFVRNQATTHTSSVAE